MIMTGIHPVCWDSAMPDEEEEPPFANDGSFQMPDDRP
jgi:hypothetical protein